jgi:NSS family neurotransmitter:Na+ symporter
MPRAAVWDEFTNGGTLSGNRRIFGVVWFLIRYVAPLVILTIFLTNLLA